ncbi:hypothetical protein D9C73_024440 [Collichthys lucidus]|uniref:Uncharacterized protein n=1 Tax=Collichthys lucidus TaxID=240159 RepID=A0A4U5VPM0_COLLU|nr:hypothetical protein D9C73_024440 [Collichthys lucidus]
MVYHDEVTIWQQHAAGQPLNTAQEEDDDLMQRLRRNVNLRQRLRRNVNLRQRLRRNVNLRQRLRRNEPASGSFGVSYTTCDAHIRRSDAVIDVSRSGLYDFSKGVNVPVCVLVFAGLQSPAAEPSAVSAQSGSDQSTRRFRRIQILEPAVYWLRHVSYTAPLTCLWLLTANQSRAQLSADSGTTLSHLIDEDKDGFHGRRTGNMLNSTRGSMVTVCNFHVVSAGSNHRGTKKETFLHYVRRSEVSMMSERRCSEEEDDCSSLLSRLGSDSPRPRIKYGGVFCSVEGAFENKTLNFESFSPWTQRRRAARTRGDNQDGGGGQTVVFPSGREIYGKREVQVKCFDF